MRFLQIFARPSTLALALVATLGLGRAPAAQADLVLDIASVPGANIEFKGSGTGATFAWNNNQSGQGFVITDSNGVGDSVGLHGSLGGTYSYTTGSISTSGSLQTAPVLTSGGALTITDAGLKTLTGTIAGIDVDTMGTGGLVNLNGTVNLSAVSYSGTNADLKELRDEAAIGGGIVALSFQFIPGESLTQLAANHADFKTSYSGTIASAVPEPSGLVLAGLGTLASLGYGLRRRSKSVGRGQE
jgi:hypothetical protein